MDVKGRIGPGGVEGLLITFERAGQVVVKLPVGYPGEPREAAETE